MDEKKTQLGLTENMEAALCYALAWITGIIFLVLENENKVVRFHAVQSIITFLTISIAGVLVSVIPGIGPVFNIIIGIGAFILWVILLVKTYQGEKFMVPVAGEMAERMAK